MLDVGYFKGKNFIEFIIPTELLNFKTGSVLFDKDGKEYKVKAITPQITSPRRVSEVFLDASEVPEGPLYVKDD